MPARGTGNLVFDANTWTPMRLFNVEPTPTKEDAPFAKGVNSKRIVMSPDGKWGYDELILPKAKPLGVCWSGGRSNIVFNEEIAIPRVFEYGEDGTRRKLWMSYTPQEVLTLRPGLRKAKGSVIVAGLGMGWLLTRVAHKPSVKRALLVEQNEALLDWLWPVIREKHWADQKTRQKMNYIIGDANKVIPERTADVALWDIWETVGHVDRYAQEDMAKKCPNIGTTWFWGANARIPNSIWDDL